MGGLIESMGELFFWCTSLDKLDIVTSPIPCQVVDKMNYVISSQLGVVLLSTTKEHWHYREKNVSKHENCIVFSTGTVVPYGLWIIHSHSHSVSLC